MMEGVPPPPNGPGRQALPPFRRVVSQNRFPKIQCDLNVKLPNATGVPAYGSPPLPGAAENAPVTMPPVHFLIARGYDDLGIC
jgi:hypothetical protein